VEEEKSRLVLSELLDERDDLGRLRSTGSRWARPPTPPEGGHERARAADAAVFLPRAPQLSGPMISRCCEDHGIRASPWQRVRRRHASQEESGIRLLDAAEDGEQ